MSKTFKGIVHHVSSCDWPDNQSRTCTFVNHHQSSVRTIHATSRAGSFFCLFELEEPLPRHTSLLCARLGHFIGPEVCRNPSLWSKVPLFHGNGLVEKQSGHGKAQTQPNKCVASPMLWIRPPTTSRTPHLLEIVMLTTHASCFEQQSRLLASSWLLSEQRCLLH